MASPKNIRLLIGFVSLLYFGFVVPQSAYALDSNNSAGAIVTVNGLAEVTRGSRKLALKAGDTILEHDVIDVAAGGSAKLLLKDHSILDIGPGTNFRVDKYFASHGADREVEVAVGHGTLRTAVTQKVEGSGKFRVKTNSATMGVRGTEFVVTAGAKTQVTVLQGQVEVAQIAPNAGSTTKNSTRAAGGGTSSGAGAGAGIGIGKALVLGSGQQVTSAPGVALPEKANNLDAVALNKISTAAKVTDNTYSRAITIVVASSANPAASQSGGAAGRAPASSSNSSAPADSSSASNGGPPSGAPASGPAANAPTANAPAANAPAESTVASSGGPAAGSAGASEGAPSNSSGSSANGPVAGAGPAPAAPPLAAAPPPPMPASGFGGTTLSDIGTTVATVVAAPPPVNTTQIGISGTFSPGPPPAPVPVKHGGSSIVTIVVK